MININCCIFRNNIFEVIEIIASNSKGLSKAKTNYSLDRKLNSVTKLGKEVADQEDPLTSFLSLPVLNVNSILQKGKIKLSN